MDPAGAGDVVAGLSVVVAAGAVDPGWRGALGDACICTTAESVRRNPNRSVFRCIGELTFRFLPHSVFGLQYLMVS